MASKSFPHDASYKYLFSSKIMIKSLLLDFVAEDFVQHLDYDDLQLVSGDYITDGFQERQNDMVWRLRWRDTWCYIFLMVEFQSSHHHWMALRMLSYTALLWENLVKSGAVKIGDKLPPIFPIVLYNGDTPWKATLNMGSLINTVHTALDKFQPAYEYYVVDIKRIPQDILQKAQGEAAYVMRGEQTESRGKIIQMAFDLDARPWPEAQNHTKMALLEWMENKIRAIDPSWGQGTEALNEEEIMLAELIAKYKQPYIEQGYSMGKDDGYNLGKDEGYSLGETGGMIRIVKEILIAKFGVIDPSWEAGIDSIRGADKLCLFSRAVTSATSPSEVTNMLNKFK